MENILLNHSDETINLSGQGIVSLQQLVGNKSLATHLKRPSLKSLDLSQNRLQSLAIAG